MLAGEWQCGTGNSTREHELSILGLSGDGLCWNKNYREGKGKKERQMEELGGKWERQNAATVDDEFGKGGWASATSPGTKMQQL